MKFTDTKKENNQDKSQNTQHSPAKTEYALIEMKSQSDNQADKFQADVVNGCGRVLDALNSCKELKDYVKTEKAEKTVKSLQNFQYTIGFAGSQSCGKSTIVNAMLQYPLMPSCKLATTNTPVEVSYSKQIRIMISDADTGKQLCDYPCDKTTDMDFKKLKEYTCMLTSYPQVIENLQPFVDGYIGDYIGGLSPEQLKMSKDNPRHVAVLMMILLTVDVKQTREEEKLPDIRKKIIWIRNKTLKYFHIPIDIPNIYVRIQWDSPILKSGLKLLDLPGLGADSENKKLENGRIAKSQDTITKEAIALTDTMVVIQEPEMRGSVVETVKHMVSNLVVKEAIVENCIVPVLNKYDLCHGAGEQQSSINEFLSMLKNIGIKKDDKDIFRLSAIFGEYAYEECFNISRTLYCSKNIDKLIARGADERRIKSKLEDLSYELEDEYKNSGVEALRKFFRTAFIERGKFEKTFSTIAEIRTLGKDAQSKIIAQKRIYEGFAGTNDVLIKNTIPKLREIANNPINKALYSISIGSIEDKISLMTGLSDRVVLDYKKAFEGAAEEYYTRNINIVEDMTLTFMGRGSFARVDS